MPISLFLLNDPNFGLTFGCKPCDPKYWQEYGQMQRRVSLKRDLRWKEVEHLQNILRKADIWTDFPARGYALVNAEFKAGDEDQRLDILYIRDDGALLPCELKIGGDSKDAHGQLIRYIADLYFQVIDRTWIKAAHDKFLATIGDDAARTLHEEKFNAFLSANNISDRFIRILPKTGVIIDEGFSSVC
jgi:hypothetical protein